MNLNLGAGTEWKHDGWMVIDHSQPRYPWQKRVQAWSLPLDDDSIDNVFASHIIEHIPVTKIEQTLMEINRVLKHGGSLRILTPDLKKLASAYIKNDRATMQNYIDEDGSGISTRLGLGGAMMNFIICGGQDNRMMSSDYSEVTGGFGHVYSYDFEMLTTLLEGYGFSIERDCCNIEKSNIPDHKELRTVPYNGDAGHSLVVEARKIKHIPFDPENTLINFRPYSHSMVVPGNYHPVSVMWRMIAYIRNVVK